MNTKNYTKQDFMNREISWLAFNDRILDLANTCWVPILERAKFLKITQSNLDEWYMIRVANLIREVQKGDKHPDKSGLSPNTQLNQARKLVKKQLKKQNKTWSRLKNLLLVKDIKIQKYEKLTEKEKTYVDSYFFTTISPLIQIELLPKDIPWPNMNNGDMYLIVDMVSSKDPTKSIYAHFKLPSLSRIFSIPDQVNHFILLEQILKTHYKKLIEEKFNGRFIAKNVYQYRILKDMGLKSIPKESKNTERSVQLALEERENAPVIFLAVDKNMPRKTLRTLTQALTVNPLNTFHLEGDWDYDFISVLCKNIVDTQKLKISDLYFKERKPYHEKKLESNEIFSAIEEDDYLLHHPYDSYNAVVNFFQQAAVDPNVEEIYVTIYRTSKNSPIIKALTDASKNGKKVYALIEVKARFDEEHNIQVADYLRRMGVKVNTSLPDLKIHGKMALVLKRKKEKTIAIAHLATGNYNDISAKSYTDFSFFTSNRIYTSDIYKIFQSINNKKKELSQNLDKLYIAPTQLRKKLQHEIKNLIKKTQQGEKCEILIKCNSLSDYKIIKDLYKASAHGVKVKLLIRGLTTAIPKLPEVSPHLHIHSVVGRLLEHSRIYIFISETSNNCFLSSADVMTRNFDRRIEILFPIENKQLKMRVNNIFERMWNDRVQSYSKKSDGTYRRRITNKNAKKYLPIQEQFLIEAQNKADNQI